MANTKSSAAARREQERRQRQRAGQTQGRRGSSGRYGRKPANSNRGWWWFAGGIVALVVVVIVVFTVLGNRQAQQAQQGSDTAIKSLTSIPASSFASVGSGSVQSSAFVRIAQTGSLKGTTGKPEVLYVGADYCPYCAAQRYIVIAALSRFGTFSNLTPVTSSESSIPTFTFHGATYKSNYIDFVGKEIQDNNNQTLDSLSSSENSILQKYDTSPYFPNSTPDSIPFVSIGNQFATAGASFDNSLLAGKSYSTIAGELDDSTSDLARGVVGGANYMTAAICLQTNNQPSNVCSADPIPALEQTLQQATVPTSLTPTAPSSAVASAALPSDIDVRRAA